jgi:hypothetical protein
MESDEVTLTSRVIDRTTRLFRNRSTYQTWHPAARAKIIDFDRQWHNLKTDEGFSAFDALIRKVNETTITIAETVDIVQTVIELPTIRRLVFNVVQSTDMKSREHILIALNSIQGTIEFGQLLQKSPYSADVLAMKNALLRQSLLDEAVLPVMRQQWLDGRCKCNGRGTGPHIGEAIKVQLALRYHLNEALQLPCAMKGISNANDLLQLNDTDKAFAIDFVNKVMDDAEQLNAALQALPVVTEQPKHELSK